MTFKEYLESFVVDQSGFYGRIFKVKLSEDSFIHFTLLSRAQQIMVDHKLLMNPPHQKFGTDSVDAISVNFGIFKPRVQITHLPIMPNDPVTCIYFKTNVFPYACYPEEIKWNCDVPFLSAKMMDARTAEQLLQQPSDFKDQIQPGEDYEIKYE